MKNFRIHLAMLVISVTALTLGMLVRTSRGQSQGQVKSDKGDVFDSRVKPTALIRDKRVESSSEARPESAALGQAAANNALLRNELNWTFGGKQQYGWYLYTPLIGHLLDTEQDATSTGFASALLRWQQKSGLMPNGVLDEDALNAMVSEWQGRRLKDHTPAQPDQLITAPVSDFYDPTRVDELRQVERETYAAYKRMIAAAVADKSLQLAGANGQLAASEKYLKIVSAFRTREYQEQLRRQSPNAGRAGLAINSPHFTGHALDLYVGGDPVDTRDSNRAVQVQTPVYLWLVRNAERFGFRPYYYEPWHWEYVPGTAEK